MLFLLVVVELPLAPGMMSEALELRLEGGRVNNSWCMGVVSRRVGLGQGLRWWLVAPNID